MHLLYLTHQGHVGGWVSWVSNFGSGHNLMVCEFKPHLSLGLTAVSTEPASDPLSPSLSASLPLIVFLSKIYIYIYIYMCVCVYLTYQTA